MAAIEENQISVASSDTKIKTPKEHASLGYLLSHIPKKAQKGLLVQCDLIMTCIDANQEYIVIGTNIGIIFLYDRKRTIMERLKTGSNNDQISCVALHEGLENKVAAGTTKGSVYIFQNLPSIMPGKNTQLQKFEVSDMHKSYVTCLTWSINGMKLFSGDVKGHVICTEVDYHQGQCKSTELLIEIDSDIVQLHHAHKCLLVSTRNRTVVCRTDDKDQLIQIGQKERKIPGPFGGVFIPDLCKTDDAQLYAVRPGMRIWQACVDGTVKATYLFKELINKPHPEITVLFSENSLSKSGDVQFGHLLLYLDKYLVTWNTSALYILSPADNEVIGSQSNIGIIEDVAVTEDEIFVLRKKTNRTIIRIATKPENTESVYEKLLQEKRLADAAARNLMSADVPVDVKADKPSPLKFFQTNIVDKIKNLDVTSVTKTDSKSVTHLKESIIKFGHDDSDSGDEEELHHHHLQKKLEQQKHKRTVNETELLNDIPPVIKPVGELEGELPPIVTLQSSDLLTVEIFSGIPSTVTKAISPLSPGNERFNPFLKDNLSDLEEDGRFSHDIDSIHQSQNVESVTKVDTRTYTSMSDKTEENIDTSVPKPLSEKLTTDILNKNDDDDIVFNAKPKHKKLKKKKGNKTKNKVEEDKISNASAEEMSIGSDSPGISRKISDDGSSNESPVHVGDKNLSHDNDSVSVKSNISDKSTRDTSSPHTTPASPHISEKSHTSPASHNITKKSHISQTSHHHTTGKGRKKSKDVFSRIEQNLDSLEGLEKHLSTTQQHCESNVGESYLKNFENRANLQDTSSGVDNKTKNENNKISADIVKQAPAESFSDGSIKSNSSKSDTLTETRKPQNKTVIESSNKENMSSDNKEESDLKKVAGRTERSISIEDSIYNKYASKDDSQTADLSRRDNTKKEHDTLLHKLPKSDIHVVQESGKCSQKQLYQTPDSSLDDFYRKFGSAHSNLSSMEEEIQQGSVKPGLVDKKNGESKSYPQSVESESGTSKPTLKDNEEEIVSESLNESDIALPYKLVNNWTEIPTIGNLSSLCLTNSHVWISDRSQNLYYSSLSGTGIKWQKANGYAKQIAVSKSGYIVWRLYKDTVYVGTRVTIKRPEGMKWEEAVREVQYIAVADSCAWYIKLNGDIMLQKGLSKDRPCFKGKNIPCSFTLKQIICQAGVVWGLTDKCNIVYRSGVTKSCVEGTDWTPIETDLLFSCITFGDGNIVWAIDVLGRICFTSNVSIENPTGEGRWWQVPMSEILVQDVTAVDALRSLAKKFDPQNFAYIMSTTTGGLISAGSCGIWVCPEYKNLLQICRGSIEGHFWEEIVMSGISQSVVWKIICATASDHQYGLVWSQQPNGDLFTFSPDSDKCSIVSQPLNHAFTCLSACKDAVWGLSNEGQVYIRAGIRSTCPQGTDWTRLDTSQLGDVHFISLSCGSQCVWSVDCDGVVFQRLGVKAPSTHSLPSVWLQVDHIQTSTVFTQVVSGPNDWMVWALDNRRQVYARIGITDTMPIGTEWIHIPGSPATQLTVSNSYVWALNPNGEILCRYGVTKENPGGDYWRQIPGIFIQISTSQNDRLWAVSREGKIYKRRTKYLLRRQQSDDPLLSGSGRPRGATSMSSDDGWELV